MRTSTWYLPIVVALVVGAGCASSSGRQENANEAGATAGAEARSGGEELLEPSAKGAMPQDAPEGGVLRRRLASNPSSLDYLNSNTADVIRLQQYVHDQYARRSRRQPDKFVPRLAKSITRSDDGKAYTIHLREGIYWQRPTVDDPGTDDEWLEERREMTAEDCVFSFELLKEPAFEPGHLDALFRDLERAVRVDRYTCKVIWEEKTRQSRASTLSWYPLPKWLYTRERNGERIPEERVPAAANDHWSQDLPIGVGPYRFVDHEEGEQITVRRFDEYWGETPPIEEIRWKVVPKPDEALAMAKRGELDVLRADPPIFDDILDEESSGRRADGELNHQSIDALLYYYIGWNHRRRPFGSAKVRRAMTHALDRQRVVEEVLHGLGDIQTGPFPQEHDASDPEVTPHEYDLEEARRLLEEAGWRHRDDDGIREKELDGETVEFSFELLVFDNTRIRTVASMHRNALRKIGVDVTLNRPGWRTMQSRIESREFDAYTGGWALDWGIGPRQIWHSSQADAADSSNHVGFADDRADQLIERAEETFDRERRIELLREFHRLIHKQQPYTFLYAPKRMYVWSDRVKNVQFGPIRPHAFSLRWYLAE